MPHAIDILEEDHRNAKQLFEDILEGGPADRAQNFEKLAAELKAHVRVEKEVFYPRITTKLGSAIPQDILEDQRKEETEATSLLEELESMGVADADFSTKLREFKEIALTHAVEVEEGRLFPIVKQKMTNRDLEELGREMLTRKTAILREIRATPAR
jgi:hemerythrin superfamily protein